MKKMLFVCCVLLLCLEPAFAGEAPVTDEDMLTVLKALGCLVLCFVGVPMLFIGLFCAGVRTIRGFFNI